MATIPTIIQQYKEYIVITQEKIEDLESALALLRKAD